MTKHLWYCPRCGIFEAEPLADERGASKFTICPTCGGLVGEPDDEEDEDKEYK
jgi:hypothetical protein